jgi:hemoglobin
MSKRALVCVILLGCAGGSTRDVPRAPQPLRAAPAAARTLYERLGGKPAVTAVIEDFLSRVTTDDRIKDRFFNVDGANLAKLLVQLVCAAAGGGCEYEGHDMKMVHTGMDVSQDELDALVSDLVAALDKLHVAAPEQHELLGAIGALQPQIVAPAAKLASQQLAAGQLDEVARLAATQPDPEVKRLLAMAVTAGKRGQRSYAEQLFTRAELIIGSEPLAKAAPVFRAGAPSRVLASPHRLADAGPQPELAGRDDEADAPKPRTPHIATLHGNLTVGGQPPQGLGVVMLYPVGGGGARRTPKQRVIEQRDYAFRPHVLAVPVGSTVAFPNYDTHYHNVFSISPSAAFDLGLYKSGDTREVKIEKPGVVRIGCNIHATMSAYVVAVDAPHYVVVDRDGSYAFKTLAPGRYQLKAWDENSGAPTMTDVEIKAGDNAHDVDLAPGERVNPDKFGNAR